MYRSLCLTALGILVISGGCDRKDQETRSRAGPAPKATRPARVVSSQPDLQRSHSDVQLYEGIVERLRRENLELRQQMSQALDTHKEMRERLQSVKAERSQAITGFKEVLDAAGQLKQNTAQLTERIQQLEQENQQLRNTITELTTQLEQLITESEALQTTVSEAIGSQPDPDLQGPSR